MRAWARDSALNLAVLRVVVGALLLSLPDLHQALDYARFDPSVRTPVLGVGWANAWLTPELIGPLEAIAIVAVALGTVGLFARASWAVAALSLLVVLAVPQTLGAAFHYHHLWWLAALLAASPCADALSMDAWRAKRRGETLDRGRSIVYGVPIRVAWVLFGIVFFFPGLHKLLTGGLAWILSDNLRNQMYAKWTQHDGFTPLFRIDRHPWLMKIGAASVVLFELSFGALVMFRRTRPWAVGAALIFHLSTAYFMNLRFGALWLCYVAFVDVSGLLGRDEPVADDDEADLRLVGAVGAVLVAGNLAFGALGISDAWPFACYPKFDRVLARPTLPALEVELVYPDGHTRLVDVREMSASGATPRWWALTWSLMGAHETARASPERFEAFWDRVGARGPLASEGYSAVRFYRATISTVPEDRDDPVLSRRLLYELERD